MTRRPVVAGDVITRHKFMDGERRFSTRAEIPARYEQETRRVKGPIFDHLENTGRVLKRTFEVAGDAAMSKVPATAAGVKDVMRRVREREAAEIAEIDAEIAELLEKHKDAVARRGEAMKRAFANGHVVTLAEVKAVAERKLAQQEERERSG